MARSFKESATRSKDRTLVVDSLNLAFRWKHQGRSDYRFELQKTIESFAQSYKCGNIIITADQGASTYRKGLLPEYKGNRKALQEKQTDEERAAFEEFIEEYEAALEVLREKYPVLRYKGVEADDIAAHLVLNREKYELGTIWLISSDRDWDLLINEQVNRFSYVTRKEVTLENWNDHYDVPVDTYISYKCLTGDAGDNVPGIKGIGPKRATDLLIEYGSAMDIYDAIPLPGKYKYLQELNANADTLLLNYELMDLLTYCDEAIGLENIEQLESELHAI